MESSRFERAFVFQSGNGNKELDGNCCCCKLELCWYCSAKGREKKLNMMGGWGGGRGGGGTSNRGGGGQGLLN